MRNKAEFEQLKMIRESRIFSWNNVSYLKLPAEQKHGIQWKSELQSRPGSDVTLVAILFSMGISAHVSRDLS